MDAGPALILPTVPVSRTVCVSMPHARMRRDLLRRHLQLRTDVVMVTGKLQFVYGLPPALCEVPPGIDLTDKSWSCYQTQLREIDRAIADDLDSLLILEDDVLFAADFGLRTTQLLHSVSRAVNAGTIRPPDIYMLGGNHRQPPVFLDGFVRCTDTTMNHAWLLTRHGLRAVSAALHDLDYVRAMRGKRKQNKDQVIASRMSAELLAVGPDKRWLAHQRAGRSDRSGSMFRSRPGWGGARTNPNIWKGAR